MNVQDKLSINAGYPNDRLDKLMDEIVKIDCCINLIIKIQSYGRVFVYDQFGLACSQEEAICSFVRADTLDDRIVKTVERFLEKVQEKYSNKKKPNPYQR